MLTVGIAGGTGAGKSTVVRNITAELQGAPIAVMPQDNYYRDNSQLLLQERQLLNFDHPNSIEFDLLVKHLQALRNGTPIEMPTYSYLSCTRNIETVTIEPCKVVIVEGILILSQAELRKELDIKVFVDAPADDRLIRTLQRDILERGRDTKAVIERYQKSVKPMHQQFIEPSKQQADIIIPQGGNNKVAISVLTGMIKATVNGLNS